MANTFKCWSCGKDSPYQLQANVMRFDAADELVNELIDEMRTYVCLHCNLENQISKSQYDWREVDGG
jgi:hypothetical protein